MDRANKHPIDQGEEAIHRTMTECQAEEVARLERIKPIYPKLKQVVDLSHLTQITHVPGNPYYEHGPDVPPAA